MKEVSLEESTATKVKEVLEKIDLEKIDLVDLDTVSRTMLLMHLYPALKHLDIVVTEGILDKIVDRNTKLQV